MSSLTQHLYFSDIVGRIYDCVLDPRAWNDVLENIRAEFGFANAVLAVNKIDGAAEFFAFARTSPEDLALVAQIYGAEIIELWGGARIKDYPLGEPIVLSRVCPQDVMRRSRYYLEYCRQRDWGDAVTIRVTDDPVAYGNVTFGQPDSAGIITDAQVDAIRLLAPHVRRAVAISHILEHRDVAATSFAATIDALHSAVVLVDELCRPVYANPVARAMLDRGDLLQIRNGSVSVKGELVRQALVRAVKQAALDEARLGERGIGMPLENATGHPAILRVLPLRSGMRSDLVQRAVAALFVHRTDNPRHMPGDVLAMLYDLTPAEIRVGEMVAAGSPPAVIARTLGVSVNTVRTHLSRLFDKTGTARQADLVRLLASLATEV